MGNLFNMDNAFFRFMGKAVDCILLSLLWLVCCIPIVTAGAATTALYYTVNKVIRHDRGYIWSEYWHAFGTNFKQSTLVWLIVVVVLFLLTMDIIIMYQRAKNGETAGAFYIVFIAMLILALMWMGYLFPYIARFENKTKAVLKNAGFMAILNLPRTVLMFLLFGVAVLAVIFIPPLILILPAVYMLLINRVVEKVFVKYMTAEDLVAEEERNRDFYN